MTSKKRMEEKIFELKELLGAMIIKKFSYECDCESCGELRTKIIIVLK